jgi:hypothetical protein
MYADIGIVAKFICDRQNNQCKASADTVNACRAVQAQVDGQRAASVANTFNNALSARSGFPLHYIASAIMTSAAFSLII